MLESDIRRLLPSEVSLPGFGKFLGILRITPDRHPVTLQQRPKYTIEFSDAASAEKFVYSLNLDYQLANPPPMTVTTLPPASIPKFSLPTQAAEQVKNDLRTLRGTLTSGNCELGCSVLLVASGLGGDSKENGKLPRTEEVRQMLEEADVQFCARDREDGGVGVQRILQFRTTDNGFKVVVRADGNSRGAESKWIVRCRNPAEAHRVVRDWNARELPNGLGKFMAEMIY
ncbi:hypothetical protein L873DRAFT_253953 [Choiromyces venosus 120613-1]|uniref:Uncharacterized protein n=1 Tax=Choiromyces venosus 120613-1 TaxID=1336337 RepID=A0A3N4JDP3_9PEZI|nr:hypothetical protein L873DRAFT_253953 [Choiromyces venosus 120613-1]